MALPPLRRESQPCSFFLPGVRHPGRVLSTAAPRPEALPPQAQSSLQCPLTMGLQAVPCHCSPMCLAWTVVPHELPSCHQ